MNDDIREWAKTVAWCLLACLLLFVCNLTIALKTLAERTFADTNATLRAVAHQVDGFSVTESDLHRVLRQSEQTLAAAQRTVNGAAVPISALGKTVQLVNAPCVPGPCGTLADVNKTLGTARGTLGQVELAVHHEAGNLDRLDGQEEQLVSDVHGTLAEVQETVGDAHTLLADPHLPVLLANAASTSTTVDHMLATFDQVETKATHAYLFPSKNPLVRTWRYVSPLLLPVAEIGAAVR